MTEGIRFYFDEHVFSAVSQGLRLRGLDVLTVQDAGRAGMADIDQLRFALFQRRVMVTFDVDYLRLARQEKHAGIAWCYASKYSVGQLIDALYVLAETLTADEMRNHIEYI